MAVLPAIILLNKVALRQKGACTVSECPQGYITTHLLAIILSTREAAQMAKRPDGFQEMSSDIRDVSSVPGLEKGQRSASACTCISDQ